MLRFRRQGARCQKLWVFPSKIYTRIYPCFPLLRSIVAVSSQVSYLPSSMLLPLTINLFQTHEVLPTCEGSSAFQVQWRDPQLVEAWKPCEPQLGSITTSELSPHGGQKEHLLEPLVISFRIDESVFSSTWWAQIYSEGGTYSRITRDW